MKRIIFAALMLFAGQAAASSCGMYYPTVLGFSGSGDQRTLSAGLTGGGFTTCSSFIGGWSISNGRVELESVDAWVGDVHVQGMAFPLTFTATGTHIEGVFWTRQSWSRDFHGFPYQPPQNGIQRMSHSFSADAVMSHAPEPETYALMLAGLGVLGLNRRRAFRFQVLVAARQSCVSPAHQ